MSYIDYLNRFNQWVESNDLPGNAQLLYFKLLGAFNRAGWPRYLRVDTLRLMLMADCSKCAAYRAREKLCQAGFIGFQKGKKGAATLYFLSAGETESETGNETESETESETGNETHIKTKTKTKNIPPDPPRGSASTRFVPPAVEEVRAYCEQRRSGVDPEAFVDFYASKGWVVGRSPMRDWQAAVRSWERKRREERRKETYGTLKDL